MRLPGLGPKTARRIWQELGITTVAGAEGGGRGGSSCAGTPASAPGTEQKIAEALARAARRRRAASRAARHDAAEAARGRRRCCASIRRRSRSSLAGSARRMRETVRDLDIIATATDPQALVDYFCSLRWVVDVAAQGTDQGDGRLARRAALRPARRAAGELRQPAAALHRLEAPQRRAARGRGAARLLGLRVLGHRRRDRRGASLRDRGRGLRAFSATTGSRRSCARTAASSPPRAKHELPALVELGDLRGDLHTHTTWSDGKDSLEDMVAAAIERGLRVLRDLRPLAAAARRLAARSRPSRSTR